MKWAISPRRQFALALGIAGILMLPTTALAATTSIQVASAKLIAKGAAVNVTVTFTCPAGDVLPDYTAYPAYGLSVYLQQAVSKTQQAFGNGFGGGQTCTGSSQTAVISVLSTVPGPPFRGGPAVATATLIECDPSFSSCSSSSSGVTVVKVRK